MPLAVITGASRGLGRATAHALAARGWHVIVDARGRARLEEVARDLPSDLVTAVPGDVTRPAHRNELAAAVAEHGQLDLLVNNASRLGPSPQPALADYPLQELRAVYEANVEAPLALIQALLPHLGGTSGARIINVSSDAAVEAYPGWGGYGSAKAALDQLSAVLAAELPEIRVYAFDPGDMRTDLHQQAFPDADISDRPEPETVLPALLRLIEEGLPSGRYRAADLTPVAGPA